MPQNVAAPPAGNKPKLLDQVRDVIRRKHFSLRTERIYCDWIRRFILFHQKKHPQDMGEPEITEFLTHLARDGLVAASTQNQALSSILFGGYSARITGLNLPCLSGGSLRSEGAGRFASFVAFCY